MEVWFLTLLTSRKVFLLNTSKIRVQIEKNKNDNDNNVSLIKNSLCYLNII